MTVLIILGVVAAAWVAFIVGVVLGAWKTFSIYDGDRLASLATQTELEGQVLAAQREAEELRADNIRLLDQKMSAS